MDLTRLLILAALFTLVFGLYQASDASAATLELDSATLQKGYTVVSADGNFSLGVLPQKTTEKLIVKIAKISSEDFPAPSGMKFLSDFYEYDLQPLGKNKKPNLLLSLSFASCLDSEKGLYFYDKNWQQWRLLSEKVAGDKFVATADFPYLIVAVLGKDESLPDALTAQSAIVVNRLNNEIVFNKNIDEIRPIASMTKLMTALVFLENNPGWEKVITMQKDDFVGGATLWVNPSDKITIRDLFYAMLAASKNNAVMALIRSTGLKIGRAHV